MATRATNIYELVSDIQARKEKAHRQPAHATFREIKAEVPGKTDGEIYALLDAEVMNGTIYQRRTINGYAYGVSEE